MNNDDIQISKIKADIAIKKAETATEQAKQSSETLEKLQKILESKQFKETAKIAAGVATEVAIKKLINEKENEANLKVKIANEYIKDANNANDANININRNLNKKVLKKKKKNLNKKYMLLFIAIVILFLLINEDKFFKRVSSLKNPTMQFNAKNF